MKAALWRAKGDIRIEDIPVPVPGPGEALLRIKACGICGSDLHEFKEGPFLIPRRPHPLTGRAGGPLILGHEFSAEVASLGPGVTEVAVGDRVTLNPLIPCNTCTYCKRGEHILCTRLGTYGIAADGAFAEFAVFPASSLLRLPEGVDDEAGAFVEPLAVALHAVVRSGMRLGDTVVVIGAGPIGLLVLQAAKAAGAARVFVVEPVASRRALALETGAAAAFDPQAGDPGAAVADMTGGLRADRAFDCVGIQAAFDTAVRVTGRRATITVVGLALKAVEVPFIRLWGHEKTLTFSSGYQDEFPAAIALLEDKRVRHAPLVTARIPLARIVEDGFNALLSGEGGHVKILVTP